MKIQIKLLLTMSLFLGACQFEGQKATVSFSSPTLTNYIQDAAPDVISVEVDGELDQSLDLSLRSKNTHHLNVVKFLRSIQNYIFSIEKEHSVYCSGFEIEFTGVTGKITKEKRSWWIGMNYEVSTVTVNSFEENNYSIDGLNTFLKENCKTNESFDSVK